MVIKQDKSPNLVKTMNENGQLISPTVSEKRKFVLKCYTIVISFFQTLLTILIVRVIDIEDDNEIANNNNVLKLKVS